MVMNDKVIYDTDIMDIFMKFHKNGFYGEIYYDFRKQKQIIIIKSFIENKSRNRKYYIHESTLMKKFLLLVIRIYKKLNLYI